MASNNVRKSIEKNTSRVRKSSNSSDSERSNNNNSIHPSERIFSPRKQATAEQRIPEFVNEGESSDMATIQKVLASKQLTSSNLDRWKRTFQSVRLNVRAEPGTGRNEEEPADSSQAKLMRHQSTSNPNDSSSDDEDMVQEIKSQEINASWGVIYPDSHFRGFWDICGLVFILIQAISLPFRLAFVDSAVPSWAIFEVIMDLFFMTDIGNF